MDDTASPGGLTAEDRVYLARRERLLRYWPVAGGTLLCLLAGLGLYLWLEVPYLVNPRALGVAIETGRLAESTVLFMAALVPVLFVALLASAVLVVLLLFVVAANERRLLAMLRRGADRRDAP